MNQRRCISGCRYRFRFKSHTLVDNDPTIATACHLLTNKKLQMGRVPISYGTSWLPIWIFQLVDDTEYVGLNTRNRHCCSVVIEMVLSISQIFSSNFGRRRLGRRQIVAVAIPGTKPPKFVPCNCMHLQI